MQIRAEEEKHIAEYMKAIPYLNIVEIPRISEAKHRAQSALDSTETLYRLGIIPEKKYRMLKETLERVIRGEVETFRLEDALKNGEGCDGRKGMKNNEKRTLEPWSKHGMMLQS